MAGFGHSCILRIKLFDCWGFVKPGDGDTTFPHSNAYYVHSTSFPGPSTGTVIQEWDNSRVVPPCPWSCYGKPNGQNCSILYKFPNPLYRLSFLLPIH